MAGIGFMERLKKLVVAGLVLLIGLFALTSCSKAIRTQSSSRTSETTQISRGPLEVTKITYVGSFKSDKNKIRKKFLKHTGEYLYAYY